MKITMQLMGREELARAMKAAEAQLSADLRQLTATTGQAVTAGAQAEAPVSSGALRRGISMTTSPRGSVATVRVRAPHAAAVSAGRRPGAKMPPKAALVEWARQHGIDPRAAFVLARAIARKGIPGKPFLDEVWARHRPAFAAAVENIVDRFTQRAVGR